MLGDRVGESRGRIIGARVLPSEGQQIWMGRCLPADQRAGGDRWARLLDRTVDMYATEMTVRQDD
jgi:hypothetical protein